MGNDGYFDAHGEWVDIDKELWRECDRGICPCDQPAQEDCWRFRSSLGHFADQGALIGLDPELPDDVDLDRVARPHYEQCPSAKAPIAVCICAQILQAREETWSAFFGALFGTVPYAPPIAPPGCHDTWCLITLIGYGPCVCSELEEARTRVWDECVDLRARGKLNLLSDPPPASDDETTTGGGQQADAA